MKRNDGSDGLSTCENHCREIKVPTDEELVVLNAMRDLKKKASFLKEQIKIVEQTGGPDALPKEAELQKELHRLKVEWKEWEGKKKEAEKRRMILLGHEDPDSGN